MSDEDHARKREELRGLFTLSLLALLLLIRTSWDKIVTVRDIHITFPFTTNYFNMDNLPPMIDWITFFWVLYAILTILRFSDDVISSEKVRRFFGNLAVTLFLLGPLAISLLFLTAVFVSYLSYFFPTSLYLFVAFVVIFATVYLVLRKYRFHVVVEPRKP